MTKQDIFSGLFAVSFAFLSVAIFVPTETDSAYLESAVYGAGVVAILSLVAWGLND